MLGSMEEYWDNIEIISLKLDISVWKEMLFVAFHV